MLKYFLLVCDDGRFATIDTQVSFPPIHGAGASPLSRGQTALARIGNDSPDEIAHRLRVSVHRPQIIVLARRILFADNEVSLSAEALRFRVFVRGPRNKQRLVTAPRLGRVVADA